MRPFELEIAAGDLPPFEHQIIAGILRKIVARELSPGDALPPAERLAGTLDVGAEVVAAAYAELARRGWLTLRGKHGPLVPALPRAATAEEAEARLSEAMFRFINEAIALGIPLEHAQERLAQAMDDYAVASRPDPAG